MNFNDHMNGNGLHIVLDRKEQVSNAQPARHTSLRTVAENLSRRNADQAVCELMNEALARLVALLYEEDAGGLCNVDNATTKVLIPLPWGRNGHARWGLRPTEADILRQVLFDWHYPGPTLLTYHRARRAWYLNLYDFSDYNAAKRWLTQHQVTIAVYRAARTKRLGGGVSGA